MEFKANLRIQDDNKLCDLIQLNFMQHCALLQISKPDN